MTDSQLTIDLFRSMKRFKKLSLHELFYNQCSFGQMAVFNILADGKTADGTSGIKMSDISDQLSMSRPAASQLIGKLEAAQLVQRKISDKNRRTVYVNLTEKGRNLYKSEIDTALIRANAIVEKMGQQNVEQLISLIDLFYIELERSIQTRKETIC